MLRLRPSPNVRVAPLVAAPQAPCYLVKNRAEFFKSLNTLGHAWQIFPVPYDFIIDSRPKVARLAAEGSTTRDRGWHYLRPRIDNFSSMPGKECGMETRFHGKKKDLCADWCRGKTGETSFAEFARPEKKRWFPKGRSGSLRICRIPVRDSAPCFLPSVFAGVSRARHRLHAPRSQLTKSRFCKIKLSRNYNSS